MVLLLNAAVKWVALSYIQVFLVSYLSLEKEIFSSCLPPSSLLDGVKIGSRSLEDSFNPDSNFIAQTV
jgi:hypothetical protein